MTIHSIVLSVDYEIFGNGSGCIDACMLAPANLIMQIADKYQAPITFFVDVSEIMIFESEPAFKGLVEKVKEQLIVAVRNGHDVQLHLHPQWSGAIYNDEGWEVNGSTWRIGDLPIRNIEEQVLNAKSWLENLIQPSSPDYKCIAFRAGGWCIQPSVNVIEALIKAGIEIDSTVAPGMKDKSPGQWFDFTSCSNKAYWKVGDEVTVEGSSPLIEFPILTGNISKLRHLQALRYAKSVNNGLANGCHGNYTMPGTYRSKVRKALDKLSKLGMAMLDFSTMPAEILIDLTQQWQMKFSRSENIVPIVAISHTKNFTEKSKIEFESYCKWAKNEGCHFTTFKALTLSLGQPGLSK